MAGETPHCSPAVPAIKTDDQRAEYIVITPHLLGRSEPNPVSVCNSQQSFSEKCRRSSKVGPCENNQQDDSSDFLNSHLPKFQHQNACCEDQSGQYQRSLSATASPVARPYAKDAYPRSLSATASPVARPYATSAYPRSLSDETTLRSTTSVACQRSSAGAFRDSVANLQPYSVSNRSSAVFEHLPRGSTSSDYDFYLRSTTSALQPCRVSQRSSAASAVLHRGSASSDFDPTGSAALIAKRSSAASTKHHRDSTCSDNVFQSPGARSKYYQPMEPRRTFDTVVHDPDRTQGRSHLPLIRKKTKRRSPSPSPLTCDGQIQRKKDENERLRLRRLTKELPQHETNDSGN